MKSFWITLIILSLTSCAPRCPNSISIEPLWLDQSKKMADIEDYINNNAGLMISASWDWNGTFYGTSLCQIPKIIRKDIKKLEE